MISLRYLPIVCLLLLCGCGGGRGFVTVSGTVRYNGKPLPGAYVSFSSEDPGIRASTGTADSSGRYQLTTFQANDGARPGKYRVTVRYEAEPEGPRLAADDINYKRGKLVTPPKYSDPEKSGLTAEVIAEKDNTFDFDLID